MVSGYYQILVRPVRVYFDTNVYRYITERQEEARVRSLLHKHGHVLTASSANLFETFAIRSRPQQRKEIETLVSVATAFEKAPESWLHALELRYELRRLRRHWLREVTFTRNVRALLQEHVARWSMACHRQLPPPDAFSEYAEDAEYGIKQRSATQKELRNRILRGEVGDLHLHSPFGGVRAINIVDPEVFWRLDALTVWYAAIERRDPAMRDYADWLMPYLKPGSFRQETYTPFWLDEASSEALPLNRLAGLVTFYQLKQKVTHGNAGDQTHAGHWLNSDLFITADRAFFLVLNNICTMHYPDHHAPVFIDRSEPSCAAQLEAVVECFRNAVNAKSEARR